MTIEQPNRSFLYFVIGVIITVSGFIIFSENRHAQSGSKGDQDASVQTKAGESNGRNITSETGEVDSQKNKNESKSVAQAPKGLSGASDSLKNGESQLTDSQINEKFASVIGEVSKCLEFKNELAENALAPTEENVITSIKGAFGDTVYKVDNWEETTIRTQGGENRRIRVENEGDEDGVEQKRLYYFTVGPQGQSVPITLPSEQSENPSDTILASLEKDGDVVGKTHSRTLIFENGEELNVKNVNGKIAEIELSRMGRSVHCSSTDTGQSQCRCTK